VVPLVQVPLTGKAVTFAALMTAGVFSATDGASNHRERIGGRGHADVARDVGLGGRHCV